MTDTSSKENEKPVEKPGSANTGKPSQGKTDGDWFDDASQAGADAIANDNAADGIVTDTSSKDNGKLAEKPAKAETAEPAHHREGVKSTDGVTTSNAKRNNVVKTQAGNSSNQNGETVTNGKSEFGANAVTSSKETKGAASLPQTSTEEQGWFTQIIQAICSST